MPVDPHTWVDNTDYLTATLLNGDFYRWNGEEFFPTGTRFHARRPIYASCSVTSSTNSIANATWGQTYQASGGTDGDSLVRGDTASLIGQWWDPFTNGNVRQNMPAGGGVAGTSPVNGGLALMFGTTMWGHISSGSGGTGIMPNGGSSGGNNPGTLQAGNSAHDVCAFVCDILDGEANRWALGCYNNTGGSAGPIVNSQPDGSDRCSRLQAQWVSVYPGNGHQVSHLPAPTSIWLPSSALDAALLNGQNGIRDVLRFLNMPPLLRAVQTTPQGGLSGASTTTINLQTVTYDTYGGFASNTYTCPFGGVYLVAGYVGCNNFNGSLRAGVQINSTKYWGPECQMPSGGNGTATKTQIFTLNQGDTIQLIARPSAGAATSTNWAPRLCVLHLTPKASGSPLAIPPDTTFRWAAGTPGPLAVPFNSYVANDLLFLTNQRPYALAYQAHAQTGIAMSTNTPVIMDTDTGIVHGDNTDVWSSFNTTSSKYTAPQNGWYLMVWENMMATPSLTSTPSCAAVAMPNPAGNVAADVYQEQFMCSGGVPGATGMAYYYLRAGDWIKPGVFLQDASSTTLSTQVGSGINSSFGIVWMGE